MASGWRYFILPEPLPASEVPNILGRVVTDKKLPMHNYAPFSSSGTDDPRHDPADIISDILPTPVIWPNRKDFFSQTSDWSIQAGLANVLGIDTSHGDQKGIYLESEELKCYALSSTTRSFNKLMQNELYNRDVRQLLKDSGRGHAYFIVGFLTTKGALWTEFSSTSRQSGFNVTVPVLEVVGSPLPGLGDPQIAPSVGKSQTYARTMEIQDERIFAVAYDIVKMSYKLTNAKKFVMSNIVNVGPVRGKAGHLMFSNDSDDEEFVDSDDESAVTEPKKPNIAGSMSVEIKERPTVEELCEPEELSIPSFKLQVA